ncbi:MAG: hypothetical protein NC218_11695 [Acetobacter sp.]|nr:hypothetical protein [Acetobacter sp.]
MTTKTTKRETLAVLAELIAAARDASIEGFDFTALEAYVDKEVEGLEKKAEQARKRAAKKKDAGDQMRDTLYGLLTTEHQTIPDLLPKMQEAMEDETISAQKLTARLKQLVDLGRVTKTEVTIPATEDTKSRRVMGYALADGADTAVEAEG